MHFISVDLGSYSIKILNFKFEKSRIKYFYAKEEFLDTDQLDVRDIKRPYKFQLEVLTNFLKEIDGQEYNLVLNIPGEFITSRILELPVNKKSKAAQMISFVLEEDIPYLLHEIHFDSQLSLYENGCHALASLCQKEDFEQFFETMVELNIKPQILTSDESIYSLYFEQNKEEQEFTDYCILDIGHQFTKAHFFNEKKLVLTQKSYIAGLSINEMISENYQIDMQQASIYKHQNAFFLTPDQMQEVDESQKVFAKYMDRNFKGLIADLKRWVISYQVKTSRPVQVIYLTGGTSNIKNISRYFKYHMGIEIRFLNLFEDENSFENLEIDENFIRKFTLSHALTTVFKKRNKLINFLKDEYTLLKDIDFPLNQFAYIFTRASILSLLIVLGMSINLFFNSKESSRLTRLIQAKVKDPALSLTDRQKRKSIRQPELVIKEISTQLKAYNEEASIINSTSQSEIVSPLLEVHDLLKSINGLEIQSISSSLSGEINLELIANSQDSIVDAKNKLLQSFHIESWNTDPNSFKAQMTGIFTR